MSNIKNPYLQSFINAIGKENRTFLTLTEEDVTLCDLLKLNFSSAQQILSGNDIYSFHFISSLDELIVTKLKVNDSLSVNELGIKLSENYYKLLSNKFGNVGDYTLDDIPWVLEALKYIDNKCDLLSHTKYLSNSYSDNTIAQSLLTIDSVNETLTGIDEIIMDLSQKNDMLNEKILNMDSKLKKQNDKILKQNETLQNQERKATESYITILGIFVTIVTVLIAGVSFTGLVTKELLTANPIKSSMFIGMISVILYDALLSLFYYLSKLTGKPIHNTDYCSFCCSKNSLKKLICPIAHNYKFAFWSNVILGSFMLFLFNLYLLTNNHINIGFTSNGISFMNVFISMSIPVLIIILLLIFTRPCQEHIDELNYSKQSSKIHVKKSEKSNKNEQ